MYCVVYEVFDISPRLRILRSTYEIAYSTITVRNSLTRISSERQ
jgi:hypothetical protein